MLLFNTWWESLPGVQQLLWMIALVGTALSIILLLLSHSGLDEESNPADRPVRNTRWALLFVTMGGWAGALTGFFVAQATTLLLIAIGGGFAALGIRVLFWYRQQSRSSFHLQEAISRTGRVMKSIPPHRAGHGTIQLEMRNAPYQVMAVTTGEVLEPGRKVRVVEVLDEKMLRVEPLSLEPNGGHGLRKTP